MANETTEIAIDNNAKATIINHPTVVNVIARRGRRGPAGLDGISPSVAEIVAAVIAAMPLGQYTLAEVIAAVIAALPDPGGPFLELAGGAMHGPITGNDSGNILQAADGSQLVDIDGHVYYSGAGGVLSNDTELHYPGPGGFVDGPRLTDKFGILNDFIGQPVADDLGQRWTGNVGFVDGSSSAGVTGQILVARSGFGPVWTDNDAHKVTICYATVFTANSAAATVFTPTIYPCRANFYLTNKSALAAGICTVVMTWTDNKGAQTLTLPAFALTALGYYSLCFPFQSQPNQAVQMSITFTGAVGTPSVYILAFCEQLIP